MTALSGNIKRREDLQLLTGKGKFVDDSHDPKTCIGYVVRSPYAHAEILSIDVSDAENVPGIRAILTAESLRQEGVGGLPCGSNFKNVDGSDIFKPHRPLLAEERVRYIGEPVAFIVADTLNHCLDAEEEVYVDYRELPAVDDPQTALANETVIWQEHGSNVCYDWALNDELPDIELFDTAVHVTEIKVKHPRIAISPIEPRSALGRYDQESENFTLHVQTQGVHSVQDVLANHVLKIPPECLRVVTRDVGGSFGMKIFTYPEYALVLVAARKIARPVKWTASRSESFLSDSQGRARVDRAWLALDSDGLITALRYEALSDLGAYPSEAGPSVASVLGSVVLGHCYRMPKTYYRATGLFTNAVPTDAYRGAGKPEIIATIEQLIDKSAFETGIDRVELRRRNLVRTDEIPYAMPNGKLIDSANFEMAMNRALEISDWHSFPARKLKSAQYGRCRGIGLGMYIHVTGGSREEVCQVRLNPDGSITATTGTQTGGQGHQSALANIIAHELEIDAAKILVVQGDTNLIETGGGTGGSSFMAIAGNATLRAVKLMLASAREKASKALEVLQSDLEYSTGKFRVPGTDLTISLERIAELGLEKEDAGDCVGSSGVEGVSTTFPNGAYVVELECEPDSGVLRIVQLVAVDDLGLILFPNMVHGQLRGAWAQSLGSVLMEGVAFDPENPGQSLNGTFMDYQLPRADDVPKIAQEFLEIPCTRNVLGTKGAGEVASLGAPGAILNALSDMLSDESFVSVEQPATPLKMWQMLRQSGVC